VSNISTKILIPEITGTVSDKDPSRTSQLEVLSKLSDYFAATGYQNPGDAYNGPFQYARNTDLHSFAWTATKPKLQKSFNTMMGLARMRPATPWYDYYPVAEKLTVASVQDTLLVDVGGGLGHDVIAFHAKYPNVKGKLVVQDLPVVIADVTALPAGIEAMAHDFFTPQPIKGAKAYYLRNTLHDWPDKQASIILASIKDAMDPESLLLVDENVLPETGVPLASAQYDIIMMVTYASLERTEREYTCLLESAGFEMVKVREQPGGTAKLFEARVKRD
jgi:hypothetical protein